MFADVIPARRMPRELSSLTYSVKNSSEKNIAVGQLVSVPFGNSNILGIVSKKYSHYPKIPIKNIRQISDILHQTPAISISQLSFLKEVSILYRAPLGFLVKSTLFSTQKKYIKQFVNFHISKKYIKQTSLFKTFIYNYNKPDAFITFLKNIHSTGQRLIIAPDIYTLDYLHSQIDDLKNTFLLHSSLSNENYFHIWVKIWQNEPVTIIGTRRAFFLPWNSLEQIIIYEEANPLHKNWDMAPRIHNRDAAKTLAIFHNASFYLTGHTPSVESYHATKKSFLPVSSLTKKKQNIFFINTNEQKKQKNYNLLGEPLKEYILSKNNKENEEYIFLFCQRKGNSSIVTCLICEKIYKCPMCENFLTYHQKLKILSCHLCHFYESFPSPCSICGGLEMRFLKNGTEALEDEIKKLNIPNFTITRLDRDAKKTFFNNQSNSQIIIGTQQAWNLVDWKKISLFAFIDIDTVLQLPEYKTNEVVWFTIRDALFRLKEGNLCIQTSDPSQLVFKNIHDPNTYYTEEIVQRKQLYYPPFSYLVKLYISDINKEKCEKAAENLYEQLHRLTKKIFPHILLSSPHATIPALFQKKYWYAIVLKLPSFTYRTILPELLTVVPSNWKIDLNPQSLLRFT